jgi:phosphoribosylaminoimidazole-succinocarboxamide synthase
MFDLGRELLIVTTDRISAFDVVLPTGIPDKGRILNQLSAFWFGMLGVDHHMIDTDLARMPAEVQKHRERLAGRTMLVHKAEPFPVECVVRGYLLGSGWKDYQATGAVCGNRLPAGMRLAEKLPEAIFTPATKEKSGHDVNIGFDEAAALVGRDIASKLRDTSLKIYRKAHDYAAARGIILADTKFEFGMRDGRILLIDEALTPDSSRFWPAEGYRPGMNPPSFDKQFVRDYLESIRWDKKPPAPTLPEDVVRQTSEKYRQAYRLITGKDLR